jgi:CheY-like chemotaxis protein
MTTSLKGLRILFADDATYAMKSTVDALRFAGASVDLATDGTEVLVYLRAHRTNPPDVLILDIMMAGGAEISLPDEGRSTGVEVYRRMREESIVIPTVISTVVSDPLILESFKHGGSIPILSKPYRVEELERDILEVLSERNKK